MADEKRKNNHTRDDDEIRIDYEKIDVEDIMRQVRERAAEQPGCPEIEDNSNQESGENDEPQPVPVLENPKPGPEFVPRVIPKAKRILLKLVRPFAPLIKLVILPVHQELLDTVHHLDYSNRRLDFLSDKLETLGNNLSQELYQSSERLNRKIDDFNQAVNERIELAFYRLEDLDKAKEYVKLLHSLSHSIVVELTKLKIESDGLKVHSRILEKDFEFLSRKETIVEKKIFE